MQDSPAASVLMRKTRFTVKAKISAWIGIVVILGLLSMLYIYRGLGHVSDYLNHLAQIDVPFSMSTIEMEKNSQEYSNGVLRYIELPRPDIRMEAEDDHADFLKHHATYMRLSAGESRLEPEQHTVARQHPSAGEMKLKLGQRIAVEHDKLHTIGSSLLQKKDELDAAFRHATNLLEDIDEIIDNQMPSALPDKEPLRSKTLAAMANIEAEAAEIGFWLSAYDSRPTKLARRRLAEKVEELADAIANYRSLPLSSRERQLGAAIASAHASVSGSIGDLLVDEDAFKALLKRFIDLETEIDKLFDGEVDAMKNESLAEPHKNANRAMKQAQVALRYVIPFYLLVALTASVLLILSIVRPLRRLASGTEAIGAGDLEYRVAERHRDEFGNLARQFNRMVVRLQETTVSKGLLQISEQRLQSTICQLQQEIAEHQATEHQREKLQSELRRSEAMAAMGSLMVGVAHEVRNPLFGISSTLDAMEASLGASGAYGRYRNVLRREVTRLNKLMEDLLEYGRPPTQEFSPARLDRIISEAAHICTPAAKAVDVVIVNRCGADIGMLQMNYGRLLQVFVNLIENAVQHAPAGTEVTIDAHMTPGEVGQQWVVCNVKDAGAGFAPEDLPYVFDPFFTRRRKGTGLGLAIVQRIVEEHKGTVAPGNLQQGGAVVTVRLPVPAPSEMIESPNRVLPLRGQES